jgi:Txe/YoeB family toxin of toxin-antitoxin system
VRYHLIYTSRAQRDAKKIARSSLKNGTLRLLKILEKDPFRTPPRYEKLLGDLTGAYSRRIITYYRLVYQVLEAEKVVRVLPMWNRYE